jgi:hypothetical protein
VWAGHVDQSTGVQRQDLSDAPALRDFIDSELRLGIKIALEDEIINGDASTSRD